MYKEVSPIFLLFFPRFFRFWRHVCRHDFTRRRPKLLYELCKLWFLMARVFDSQLIRRLFAEYCDWIGRPWNPSIGGVWNNHEFCSFILGGSVAKWFSDGAQLPMGLRPGLIPNHVAGFHNGKWLSRAVRETNRRSDIERCIVVTCRVQLDLCFTPYPVVRNDSSVSLAGYFLMGNLEDALDVTLTCTHSCRERKLKK